MRIQGRIAAAFAVVGSAAALLPGAAGAVTYQTGPVTVPGTAPNQAATPYPMPLRINGVPGTISDLEIKLLDVTTPQPAAIDALLVGPGGQKVMLMSDACGSTPLSGHTFHFDADTDRRLPLTSCAALNDVPVAPTDYEVGESLNPPSPLAPYGTSLAVYEGGSPNGTWHLWLRADTQVPVQIIGILAAVSIPAFFGKDRCGNAPATIFGTDGSEKIQGTPAPDVILARGGNDRVDGGAGDDIICTGPGRDRLNGGRGGDDTLRAGSGRDRLRGADGDDRLQGHKGRDKLIGGTGEDRCLGGPGADTYAQCEEGETD